MSRRAWGGPGWIAGLAALCLALLPLGAEARAADSAVVLVYQRIGEAKRHPESSVTLAQFEAHLDILKSGGYSVLPLADILAALDAGRSMPDRAVALSFDNGFASVAREAWPRLRALGFPITLFIATDAVDAAGPDQMSWKTLRALMAEGVTIGTRGARNRPLWRLDDAGRRADLERAIARFQAELGTAPAFLAFPDGEYDAALMKTARTLGFRAAFALASGPVHAGSDRFALPRFELNEAFAGAGRFAQVASALPLPVHGRAPDGTVLYAIPDEVAFSVDETVGALDSLTCFQSRVGPIAIEVDSARRVRARLGAPFAPGHDNRVNCTMPAGDGRIRWLGLQYVVP